MDSNMAIIVIGIAALVVFAAYKIICLVVASPDKKKQIIGDVLYQLALEAERAYGSQTGQAKKKYVIAAFYEKFPALTYFVKEDALSEIIDDVVAEMSAWLKANPVAAENILGK